MRTQARPIATAASVFGLPGRTFAILVLAAALFAVSPALAQETFMGSPVTPHGGTYKAINNVNVRSKPATSGKRVGSLKKGDLVQAVGWSKDGFWLALTKDGKKRGFVYAPLLKIEIAAPVVFTRPMTPVSGTYLVSRDIRVRAKPRTKSSEINRLSKGERVEAVGRPKDSAWLAVSKGGKNLGYVYSPALLPLINGSLDAEIKGKASFGGNLNCDYAVRFEGKNQAEGGDFDISDYEIAYTCKRRGKEISFTALMFITEAPYQVTDKGVYQISIDVLEIEDGYDDIFSTILMYQRSSDLVVFDSVSMKNYMRPPSEKEMPAMSVSEALAAAVEMAPGAWNEKFWQAIAKVNP
jgi:uncharacterized protein YgiM (DUF1202 family)